MLPLPNITKYLEYAGNFSGSLAIFCKISVTFPFSQTNGTYHDTDKQFDRRAMSQAAEDFVT